nr:hypothetical protein [uncultured Mediterranean phage uvMED]
MNIQYKILFNRDNHNKTIQNNIQALKDYCKASQNEPFFCSIGFVGGGDIEQENTSFDLSLWVDNNFVFRYQLNEYILQTFKGCKVYIVEGDVKPYLLTPNE